jgi:hypothetical protein
VFVSAAFFTLAGSAEEGRSDRSTQQGGDRILVEKDQVFGRRNFVRRLMRLGALSGMAGFLVGTQRNMLPSVQADDGEPLIIGQYNEGNSQTQLHGDMEGPCLSAVSETLTSGWGEHGSTGFMGRAEATSGGSFGVEGFVYSPDGTGVQGRNWATNGGGIGVMGLSESPGGIGVQGGCDEGTGVWGGGKFGVRGDSNSPDGQGVFGQSTADGTGVFGLGRVGVQGRSDSTEGCAVYGEAYGGGTSFGVQGFAWTGGIGVQGRTWGKNGSGFGVQGVSESPNGTGVCGDCDDGTGVLGRGKWGVVGNSESSGGAGVDGYASNLASNSPGVHGQSDAPEGCGVLGEATAGGVGVLARSLTPGKALLVEGVASFSTAGAGLIPAKSSSADVENTRVTGNSHITITFTDNPGSASVQWIARKPGVGFTVNLTDKVKASTSFTYLIVEPS